MATESTRAESEASGSRSAGAPTAAAKARSEQLAIAVVALLIVAAVLVWWAWKQGAYFGSSFYPGMVVLGGLLIVLLAAAPSKTLLCGPGRIALAAIAALAAWTLLSIAWTSAPGLAVQYAGHTTLYAIAFGLGIVCWRLLGRQSMLALAPVAAAGVAIAVATVITLATGTDLASYVHDDATLRLPIGYRNANAAFFLICLWPLIALAAESNARWPLRALMVGCGTLLLELVVLSQSRGSLPAAALSLVVLVAFAPRRLRAGAYFGLAVLPVLPALPILLDVFQHGEADPELVPLLRDATKAIALSSIFSVLLAAACIRGVEMRLDLGAERMRMLSRVAVAVTAVVLLIGGIVALQRQGGPIEFVDQRVSEFKRGGNPDLSAQGVRFGANVGSNRGDFWRVALEQARADPIAGSGAGSFSVTYLQERDSDESPKDPHGTELLMASELGLVGLLLLAAFVGAVAVACLGSRKTDRTSAALVAGAVAAGTDWLAHGSYDWLWNYPALSTAAMFVLGAAVAPSSLRSSAVREKGGRWVAIAVTAVALLVAVPLFLSERYAGRAYGNWGQDPGGAVDDLDRAATLNPFDSRPLLAKGVIETRTGREEEAIASFRDALDREPEGYAGHYFLAKALASSDATVARAAVGEALRLNPDDPDVVALSRKLDRGSD